MYVRMALIITMLDLNTKTTLLRGNTYPHVACKNPNCITCTEKYLPKSFLSIGDSLLECEYCNERLLLER
jgi:aspartate carbamoyltransferase catalytic subunit